MSPSKYSEKANKIMRALLDLESNSLVLTQEQLESEINKQLVQAAELNNHKPTDTIYYECKQCAERIIENKKSGIKWNS